MLSTRAKNLSFILKFILKTTVITSWSADIRHLKSMWSVSSISLHDSRSFEIWFPSNTLPWYFERMAPLKGCLNLFPQLSCSLRYQVVAFSTAIGRFRAISGLFPCLFWAILRVRVKNIGYNWSRPVWAGPDLSGPVSTDLDRSKPVRTGLDRCGPVQYGLFRSRRPVKTGLDRSRPVQTGLLPYFWIQARTVPSKNF